MTFSDKEHDIVLGNCDTVTNFSSKGFVTGKDGAWYAEMNMGQGKVGDTLNYESVCRNIFAELCAQGAIDFVPSEIGSYWLNDKGDSNTEIDVMAVDNHNRLLFVGEFKYHHQSVDADVYFDLHKKVEESAEIASAFKGYLIIYGVFSKSGFKTRLLDVASNNPNVVLVNEMEVIG